MRSILAIFAIVPLALAATLSGCASTERAAGASAADSSDFTRDTRPLETEDATLVVRGLSCPKCANNVNLALGKLPGIAETHIDMGKGEVHVVFDPVSPARPSKAQLARAITDAGFTIVDVRTN